MQKKRIIANCLLVLTALIWGSAFVAQSVGMDYVQPFTFNAVRNLVGCAVLLPVIFVMDKLRAKQGAAPAPKSSRALWLGGALCGTALCVASCLQQMGLGQPGTTSGKAGFITALYIVLVPVMGLFLKKSVPFFVWISVILATVGLYLLCITQAFTITKGDFFVLLCAVVFSLHILLVDHFSPRVDAVRLSCIQFFITGVLSSIAAFVFETPNLHNILAAWLPVLYAGILSSGVAFTLQIIAQKDTEPAVASLLMSLESVFAVLTGWLVLGETLTTKEAAGCALVFCAIILAQLPQGFFAQVFGKRKVNENLEIK